MKLTLDLEPEENPFEDLALILFHSSAPNYSFVDDLNHLYSLTLARKDDLILSDFPFPLFSCRDTLRQLSYHLLERPSASASQPLPSLWAPLHKLLIIQGEDAHRQADTILAEFSLLPPAPSPDDLANFARHQILANFHAAFTPVTLLDPDAPLPPDASRKTRREYADLQQLLASILQQFDLHPTTT